jgi:hypothetical protein
MTNVQILPVDFFPSTTNPVNPLLYEAVQKWCKERFGAAPELHKELKTWVAVSHGDEGYRVHSLVSARLGVDCHTFHVDKADDAAMIRDAMLTRAASFIADQFGAGTKVMVYVAPEKERIWRRFLKLIRAVPANRWIVEV